MSIINIVRDVLILPLKGVIKKHLVLILCLMGFVLILAGGMSNGAIDRLYPGLIGLEAIILKTGSAILGGGVFAALMKSAQFSEIFQRNVHAVFYSPGSMVGLEETKRRWKILTISIFQKYLTSSCEQAANKVCDIFFSKKQEYHFEDMEITLELQLAPNKKDLHIRIARKVTVIIAPNVTPAITHTIKGGYNHKLTSLVIDGEPKTPKDYFTPSADNPNHMTFKLPFKKYCKSSGFSASRSFTLERLNEYDQDISIEPFIIINSIRFVCGLIVKVKVIDCLSYFATTGIDEFDDSEGKIEGTGFKRWQIAGNQEMLLPGQGFLVVVTPTQTP